MTTAVGVSLPFGFLPAEAPTRSYAAAAAVAAAADSVPVERYSSNSVCSPRRRSAFWHCQRPTSDCGVKPRTLPTAWLSSLDPRR